MQIEKYELEADRSLTTFDFVSQGPKGAIHKQIKFQPMIESKLYNLAFGDVDPKTGGIDDLAVSDNGDTEKILATVVSAVYLFLDHYPNITVYASSSTKARTRLYRMGINQYIKEIQETFHLFGQIKNELFRYEKGVDYDGFVAQRKIY